MKSLDFDKILVCAACHPGKTCLADYPHLPDYVQISHSICDYHKEGMLKRYAEFMLQERADAGPLVLRAKRH